MTLRVHPDEIVKSSESPLLGKHESWERVRLGDVADLLNGFAFRSEQFSHEGDVPLLRIRDVGSAATKIGYSGEYDSRYIVNPGTIVVGMDGDFRAARWSGPPALLNQRVCTITVRNPMVYDESFLLYALPGYLDAIHSWTSSITVKHLSSETIKEIPLPLPPLTEQRRIVAAIEEHISRLDAADASMSAATQRATSLQARLLNSVIEGHPSVPLGTVTRAHRYGTSVKCVTQSGGVPVLRIPNIRNGRIDMSDLKFATRRDLGDCFVEGGDLLIVRTNGSRDLIGRAAVVDGAAGMAFASYLIRIRPSEDLDPNWATVTLSSPRLRAEIEARAATTAGQYNLNLASLKSLPIPLPPPEEQRRLVIKVQEQRSAITALQDAIRLAQRRSASLRRAVFECAFRGGLVPQDPSDEHASVLLGRIRSEHPAPSAKPRRRRVHE